MKLLVAGMNRCAAEPLGDSAPIPRNCSEQYAAPDLGCARLGGGEGPGLKTRDNQPRRLRRPHSNEQIGNDRPGGRFSAAYGLQLDIRTEAEFRGEGNRLLQRRNSFLRESRIEPTPCVVMSDRFERQHTHLAAPVRRALEPIIMQQNRYIITGEANVEFDPAAAEGLCRAQGRKCVLGRTGGHAAVANYPREKFLKAGILRRDPTSGCQVAAFTCCSWRSGRREPRSSPVS